MESKWVLGVSRALLLFLLCSCPAICGATELTKNTTIKSGDSRYDGGDIVINGCTVIINGGHVFSSLAVTGGGMLTCSEENGMFLRVLGDVTVESDASIDFDGMGAVVRDGKGVGSNGKNAAGGGHGGKGGIGDAGTVGGEAYDSMLTPSLPGSCGGTGVYGNISAPGAYGGGFIRIIAEGELHVDGRITASGMDGGTYAGWADSKGTEWATCSGGGGAGGTIYLEVNTLSGTGSIAADGGNNGRNRNPSVVGAGGGGGGRIALYYGSKTFTGTLSVQGGGDRGGTVMDEHRGEDGTILVNGVFAVSIGSPATETRHVAGKAIRFEAVHMYGLAPFAYTWTFSRQTDGQGEVDAGLGYGEVLQKSLSQGTYTVTLSGTDASGATAQAKIVLIVMSQETGYSATVQADPETAAAGTPVTFAGQAIWVDDTPAADVDVVVNVVTQGIRRRLSAVTTDASGRFKTVWQPFENEAGRYQVAADRPNVVDEASEDEFSLFGADIEPNAVDCRLVVGRRIERTVAIRNLGDIELSGLSARVTNAPGNLVVEPNCPESLGPKAFASLKCSIRALDASTRDGRFDVVISREQATVATLHVRAEVVPMAAVLKAYPEEIGVGMVRGDQTLVDIEVVNLGGSSSVAMTVCPPADAAWISLVTPENIGPLEPNESATVTLQLRPEAAMSPGSHQGDLAIGDGQVEVTVPCRFDCISAAVGGLTVTAVDESTYYASGAPKLPGARVSVVDAQTGQRVDAADTNDAGVAEFSNLPDAYYNIEVDADGHDAFRTMLRIAAGDQAQLTAFLPRRLVAYRWTVLTDEIEGRYDFQVEAEPVANAPVPVVTVEPLVLNLCDLTAADTDVRYTFKNGGLLAAQDVRLTFRNVAGFEFMPLVDTIDLPAGSSVEVPVRIHNSNASAGVSGPCGGGNRCEVGTHELSYDLRCGDNTLRYTTPFFARVGAGNCYEPPRGGGVIGTGPGVAVAGGHGLVDQVVPCAACSARVRIETDRDSVLAGDALTATLQLDNGSATISLEKIRAGLAIRDEEGTPGEHLFDIAPVQGAGADNISGTGSLPAGGSLTAQWLITPAMNAACAEPQRYEISGELSCTVNGETFTMILYPACITVLPNPQLAVKYFVERDVSGDDPLTDVVESATPFSLGMMVTNHGCGLAGDVRVVASQPRIVEDGRDQPIDFKIVGTRIGRDVIAPVLNACLGDIQPETTRVVHWLMQSSLSGRFEDYRASLMYGDALGDKRLAMAGETPLYELSHVVRVVLPGDDGISDFLTNSPDTHLPDALHLSDGSVHPVAAIPHTLSRIAVLGNHVYLTIPGAPTGYFYVQFPDTSLSTSTLTGMIRSDGVAIPVGENVWTTRQFVPAEGRPPYEGSVLHLFDCGGPGAYILDYSDLPPLKVETSYFLERTIYGDDPFTKDVEPAKPFSLGLIVRNQGYATAKDVWIIASPPAIVDYANQRLPDPNIVAVSIGPDDVSPSLQIKIGDMEVNELKVIHWVMESSFEGRLEDWNVEVVQMDGTGGRYPLDISSVQVHDLEHAVQATWSDDGACDFLTYDTRNTYGLPTTLCLSDGSVWPEPVTGLVRMVHELIRIRDHVQIRLAVVGVADGPFYVSYPDPTEGKLKLVAVTRSDGVSIPVGPNAWTTHRIVRRPPWQPYEENLLHLVDYGGPGSYTFEYELGDWKSIFSDEP